MISPFGRTGWWPRPARNARTMESRMGHGTRAGRRPLHVPVFPIERQRMTDAPVPPSWTLRRALCWAIIPLIGFALAFWLVYGVIQPEAIGLLCAQADAPGWCRPRE